MMRKQIGRYHSERCAHHSGRVGIKPSEILAKDHKNGDEKIRQFFDLIIALKLFNPFRLWCVDDIPHRNLLVHC